MKTTLLALVLLCAANLQAGPFDETAMGGVNIRAHYLPPKAQPGFTKHNQDGVAQPHFVQSLRLGSGHED